LPDLVALLEENKKFKQQLKIAEMEKEFLKKRQLMCPVFSARLNNTVSWNANLPNYINNILQWLEPAFLSLINFICTD
jgi:hypothetical protein